MIVSLLLIENTLIYNVADPEKSSVDYFLLKVVTPSTCALNIT